MKTEPRPTPSYSRCRTTVREAGTRSDFKGTQTGSSRVSADMNADLNTKRDALDRMTAKEGSGSMTHYPEDGIIKCRRAPAPDWLPGVRSA